MAKPTVVTKDRSFATVPPNLRFDTHAQRGCPPFRCHTFGSLGGGLPPRTPGPDSSRQTAAGFQQIPRIEARGYAPAWA